MFLRRVTGFILVLALALCLTVTARAEDGALVLAIPDAQGDAVEAAAAIVVEAETGRVLFAQEAEKRLPIASTTKIMTALLTLEQPELDAVFEVDADAIRVEGSSMGLVAGDKATLRTLAAGMLLSSGNDAANAAAVRISGSVPSFVAAMNRRAASLGMENTSFETPSGLDGERHFSTAYDLAVLTREALENEEFAALCSQYRLRASYGNPPYDRWLTNHNRLLTYYEGTIGVKTGFTKKAGRCLVSAARRDGVTLITVTLGCPDDWNVHESLYERFFGKVRVEDLARDVPAVTVPVTGGVLPSVGAAPYDKAPVPVPAEGYRLEYRVKTPPFLYAPVRAGQSVGEVEILLDGVEVARLSLTAARNIALAHEFEEEAGWVEWLKGLFDKDRREANE